MPPEAKRVDRTRPAKPSRTRTHLPHDPRDVARVVQPAVVRPLEAHAQVTERFADAHLLRPAPGAGELGLEVQVPRAERVSDPVVGAVLMELVPIVVAPRAEERAVEGG